MTTQPSGSNVVIIPRSLRTSDVLKDGAAAVGLTLRLEQPEDRGFIDHLYASNRMGEMSGSGIPKKFWKEYLSLYAHAQWNHFDKVFRSQSDFWLIQRDAEPIGRLYLFATESAIHIIDVTLMPEARGRGVGTALLRALQTCATREAKALTAEVALTNRAAALFGRLGFQRENDQRRALGMRWQPPALIETS